MKIQIYVTCYINNQPIFECTIYKFRINRENENLLIHIAMSITKYNEKRNFNSSAEPKGEIKKSGNELVFVVQKHAASHLHYDFRLEMDGVLKSWAVPKGPSMNPDDKRLAVMVEDHPYDYKDFEGNIAEGNYGAGNVIVWDNGTYLPIDTVNTDDAEKTLLKGLEKGHLRFILKGKKLKGEFSLVKLKGKQDNAWLLIKHTDEFSNNSDVLAENKSVLTGITLEKLEQNQKNATSSKKKVKIVDEKENSGNTTPEFIEPMLAETAKKPFINADWLFEIKYDGYRTIAVVDKENVKLFSRNKLSFTANFKAIAEALKNVGHNVVLDGEVVIEDETGRSDFQLLQNYQKSGKGTLKYYVFDILNLDGNDTRSLTLVERKELLKLLITPLKLSNVIYSEHVLEKGESFFENAIKHNYEGVMAKAANSPYRSGKRSHEWLKIKITRQEEAIIVGITEPKGARNYFGALLLAQYEGKSLKYIGNCGTGFDEKTLKDLYGRFKASFTDKPAFTKKINLKSKVQWMKPKFVCQVKFTEWTESKHMRHPVFIGLRTDKKPEDVIGISSEKEPEANGKAENPDNKTATNNTIDLKIGKINLHLTNQHKIYFPDDGYTKGDIINYYSEVAEIMLPYLINRPQSMNRFPDGINGKSFYHKDVDISKIPSWLETSQIYSESNKGEIDYLLCNNKATLLYMANLGCIEINPWNSSVKNIQNPDWIVIDLDPEKIDFKEVVRTALVVKDVMEELETDCYCKTSGATGLHIYIPLAAQYEYDTVKIFAELIAHTVNVRLPETTSIVRPLNQRQNRVYIDFLQNRIGQTLAAPYSVRPKPGATVSTPLHWIEVNEKLSPQQFTIKNTLKRLKQEGDLWKPVLEKGTDISKILQSISDNE